MGHEVGTGGLDDLLEKADYEGREVECGQRDLKPREGLKA